MSDWRAVYGLWDSPPKEWRKVTPEHAHALVAAQEVVCDDCGDRIKAEGPLRIFVDQDGLTHHFFCAACVRAFAERKTLERIASSILDKCPHWRSRGRVTQQLLSEGFRLLDVRSAFLELEEDGQLERDKRGMVRARVESEDAS